MATARTDGEWEIVIETGSRGETTVVNRRGAWFSGADDLEDAIGILHGQRASSVTINDNGYVTTRRL